MGGEGRSYGSQVLVFFAAAVYLGWGVWRVPLASGYTDPVRKVRPQDDLFRHVNGAWLTKTEIPADRPTTARPPPWRGSSTSWRATWLSLPARVGR